MTEGAADWIPAYAGMTEGAGMTEWAPLDSGLRRNDGVGAPGFRRRPEWAAAATAGGAAEPGDRCAAADLSEL